MNPSKPEPSSAAQETSGNGNRQPSSENKGIAAKSHEAATRVKDVALSRVDEAKSAADTAKHRASERVRAFGAAVRSLGHHLRAGDERVIANYAERASERIETIASFIETAEPQSLVRQGEDLARRNPLAFFGGSFVIGLTLGRFLKSSTQVAASGDTGTYARLPEDRSYARGTEP